MDYQAIFEFGADVAYAFVNDGNPVRILQILDDAHSADPQLSAAGSAACRGVFATFASTLDAAKKVGVSFQNPVPTAAEFAYESARGAVAYSAIAQRLYDSIVALRLGAPEMKVSRGKPMPKTSVDTIERDPVTLEISRVTTVHG